MRRRGANAKGRRVIDTWILEHGEQAQYILFFGLLGLLGIAERLAPRRPGPMKRRLRWFANFSLTALNIVVLSVLPIGFIGAATFAANSGFGLLNATGAAAAIAIPTTLLARSFISFAIHWLSHKLPWLWRLHRVHHLDTELDVSTTVRIHPAEFIVQLALGLPVVMLLGLSPWVLMAYELADVAVTLFSHANIRLPRSIERALRYVIVTPELHRVHHSAEQPETDSNFGAVLPLWDLVFGTFRTQTMVPQESMVLGLTEVRDRRACSLRWLLASPWQSLTPASASAIAASVPDARGGRAEQP
jgi:sterol desaturase/sphingolipid hydroxylase (fatty acid hydroxylase superfamily)